jgi:hypothetical protein
VAAAFDHQHRTPEVSMTLADVDKKASGDSPDRRVGGDTLTGQGSPIYDAMIAELGDPTASSADHSS